jgi:uncharacterized membrane protein YfcA
VFVVDPALLAVAFVVTFVAATVQGTVGFGFAMLSVPLLALMDSRLAPVPQLFLSLPLCLWVAWRERRALKIAEVSWILVGRLPGAGLGVVLLTTLSSRWLDGMIAAVVILAVVIIASGREVARTRSTKFGAGVVSGTFAMVASIGGPPLALLYGKSKGETLRANLAAVFVFGQFVTVGARLVAKAIDTTDVIVAAWLLPAVFLAAYVSGPLSSRVEGPALRRAVILISSLAGIGLLLRALW